MIHNRIISEIDDWKFQQELDSAIEQELQAGNELTDILFSTCPVALSPFADTDKAESYSVTRYSAILFFSPRA